MSARVERSGKERTQGWNVKGVEFCKISNEEEAACHSTSKGYICLSQVWTEEIDNWYSD